jgi:hypothetical protein
MGQPSWKDRFWQWVADHLPRPVVYFAAMRLMGETVRVDEDWWGFTCNDALIRWSNHSACGTGPVPTENEKGSEQ